MVRCHRFLVQQACPVVARRISVLLSGQQRRPRHATNLLFLLGATATATTSSSSNRCLLSTNSSDRNCDTNTLPNVEIVMVQAPTSLQDVFPSFRKPTSSKEDLPPEDLVLRSRNWAKNFPNQRLENLSTHSLVQLCELLGLSHTVRATKEQLLERIDLLARQQRMDKRDDDDNGEHRTTTIPDSSSLQRMDRCDLAVLASQLDLSPRVPATDGSMLERIKMVRNYLLRQVADPYVDRFVEPQDRLLYEHGEDFLKQVARDLGVGRDGTAYHLTKKLRGPLSVLTEPEKMLLNYYDGVREIKRLCRSMGIEVDKSKITLLRRLDSMRLAQLLIQQRLEIGATAASADDSVASPGLLSWKDDPQMWERQCTDTFSVEQLRSLCADWSLRYKPRKKYTKFELVKLLCQGLHIRLPDNPVQARRRWLDRETAELKRRLGDAYVKPAPYSGADPLGAIQYGHLRRQSSRTDITDSIKDGDGSRIDSASEEEEEDGHDDELDLNDFNNSNSAYDKSDYDGENDDRNSGKESIRVKEKT